MPVDLHATSRRRALRTALSSGVGLGAAYLALRLPPAPADAAIPPATQMLLSSTATTATSCPDQVCDDDRSEWLAFKRRFIHPDGRVIDSANGGISHTEGQGWGMLFAVAFDDRETFDRLHSFTATNLRRPDDALHAWRFDPLAAKPVSDLNNATDGDLFIAGALARAARRWDSPEHAAAAAAIAGDVLRLLVRNVRGHNVLLPGAYGFERRDTYVVNPSYYVFPMIDELSALAPSPLWTRLRADGLSLIQAARFGRWQLPPDWLRVGRSDSALAPAPGWPARFSYDAIRVPLYLTWGGSMRDDMRRAFASFWNGVPGGGRAWADLQTNEVSRDRADAGIEAVMRLATEARADMPMMMPSVAAAEHYYAAGLVLLSRLSWRETYDAASGHRIAAM